MHRRQFLCGSLAAAVGLRAAAVPFVAPEKPPRHLILLWMAGGLSHLDLWDIKEGSANQGAFKAIDTAVPGIRIGELLPNVAREFKNLSIIRAMRSEEGDLARATYRMTHAWPSNVLGVKLPGVGSVVANCCGSPSAPLPRCITMGGDPGFGDAGNRAPTFAGFPVENPGVPPGNLRRDDDGDATRTADRRHFLDLLDDNFASERMPHIKKEADREKVRDASQNLRELHQVAWEYARRVDPKLFSFDAKDTAKLPDRFGNNGFGRGCLLAAKLIAAGSAAVSVTLGGWDMHGNFATSLPPLAGVLDQGFAGLMAELRDTGLLKETVVLCAGPFGRSPRINQNGARIPWGRGWSVVLGGCGIGGVEYGKTDKDGMAILDKPVSPSELYATIYTALGLDLKDPKTVMVGEEGNRGWGGPGTIPPRPIKELLDTVKG